VGRFLRRAQGAQGLRRWKLGDDIESSHSIDISLYFFDRIREHNVIVIYLPVRQLFPRDLRFGFGYDLMRLQAFFAEIAVVEGSFIS
jgi:hypothetical protein